MTEDTIMKISRIILAAACAATMFSCSKENLSDTQKVHLTFSVTSEPSALKAALNANAVEFRAGDKIGVWDGTGGRRAREFLGYCSLRCYLYPDKPLQR